MAKKKSRPKQERGLRTRDALLQAAVQSLVESHIYGLRFAQISKIAKVPQPLIDYHFPSLEALLSEMVGQQLEKLKTLSVEAIEAHASKPRKALEAYIRVVFQVAQADAGFRAVWSAYYHLTTVNKNFAAFNRGVRQMGHQRITALVSAVAQNEKRKNAGSARAANETATCIQGIITGYGFMAAAETDGEFKALADLAVKASFQLLEANFPLAA